VISVSPALPLQLRPQIQLQLQPRQAPAPFLVVETSLLNGASVAVMDMPVLLSVSLRTSASLAASTGLHVSNEELLSSLRFCWTPSTVSQEASNATMLHCQGLSLNHEDWCK
jgi:hypothetical protein